MPATAIFEIGVLMSFISSTVAARYLAWPQLSMMERDRALTFLVAPHMFLRFLGLSFFVPGVVSSSLPTAFANSAVYGDFVAGIMAIIATIALVKRASWAAASVWLFNVWGAADLIVAFYHGRLVGLQPGALGASFYLVTAIVPPLLVSHALVFGLLLSRKPLKTNN